MRQEGEGERRGLWCDLLELEEGAVGLWCPLQDLIGAVDFEGESWGSVWGSGLEGFEFALELVDTTEAISS